MNWKICCIALSAIVFLSLGQQGDSKPYERSRRNAEDKSPSDTCQLDRYRCGTKCIPLRWICDGYDDCDDRLDERNCIPTNQNSTIVTRGKESQEAGEIQEDSTSTFTSSECSPNAFSCDKGGKCLKMSSLCDTSRDCEDGSDEANCPTLECESTSKFSCDAGEKCLPLSWLCDNINDCIDSKDEHNCPKRKEGVSIAQAAEQAAVTAAQEAKRAAYVAQEMMKSAKEAADKAKQAMKIAVENS